MANRIQQSNLAIPRLKTFPIGVLDTVRDQPTRAAIQQLMQSDDQWAQKVAQWANNAFVTKLYAGSASGTDYSTISATLGDVDATNLKFTRTIPFGQQVLLSAKGAGYVSANGVVLTIALVDTTTPTTLNSVVLANTANYDTPWAVDWIVTGDGTAHTYSLRFAVASNTGKIVNQTAQVATLLLQSIPAMSETVT